jgi:hypothetical protein
VVLKLKNFAHADDYLDLERKLFDCPIYTNYFGTEDKILKNIFAKKVWQNIGGFCSKYC